MPRDIPTPSDDEIQQIIDRLSGLEGPMLPILHEIQAEFGHVPPSAVSLIARALNLTAAEVHGVISFYHDFRNAPAGRHVVKICRAEACQAMGGAAMAERVLSALGVDWHGTTANGAVTVEPVYCLGLCACAPAAMIDDRVMGRVDEASLGAAIKECGA